MLSTQRAIQRKINMGKNNAHDEKPSGQFEPNLAGIHY
jgi:hypothetical protein